MIKFVLLLIFSLKFHNYSCEDNNAIRWLIPPNEENFKFYATLHQDTKDIQTFPVLQVNSSKGSKVCSYKLYWPEPNPLSNYLAVDIIDKDAGIGRIFWRNANSDNEVSQYLNEGQKVSFKIAALDCSTPPVESKHQIIELEVVAEEHPRWTQPVYNAQVTDDLPIGTNVIRVVAYENGKSPANSICNYKIDAPLDSPFDIDGHGMIKTRDYLNANEHANYVLRIKAEDCWAGQPRASIVSVNIAVKHVCRNRWTGIPEQINYIPRSGVRPLAESAEFELCNQDNSDGLKLPGDDALCEPERVTSSVTLEGIEQSPCELDTLSLKNQRKICKSNELFIDLLPSAELFLNQGNGVIHSDNGAYVFDGYSTRWDVPTSAVPASHNLGNRFTLTFWMKHSGEDTKSNHNGVKEQILCNADGQVKNRHHYSLFIRNCKLILLLRQEPSDDAGSYKIHDEELPPAEWRFKLSQVCDGKWHHYSFSFKHTEGRDRIGDYSVDLLIDGARVEHTAKTFDQISDFPLKKNKNILFTTMTIGACWHAGNQQHTQYFKGELAGMRLLRGFVEPESTLKCLSRCRETLDFHAMSQMQPGMSVSLNSEMTMIILNGHSYKEVGTLLKKIGYLNSRSRPVPGKRTITITTEIRCRTSRALVQIPESVISVLVLSPTSALSYNNDDDDKLKQSDPITTPPLLSGTEILPVYEEALSPKNGLGQLIISDLRIQAEDMLDSCILRTWPHLDFPKEYITWPRHEVERLSQSGGSVLYGVNTTSGLVIEGMQAAGIYQELLRKVRYLDTRADSGTELRSERQWRLVCSQENGDVQSNELLIKLEILRPASSIFSSVSPSESTRAGRNDEAHIIVDEVPLPAVHYHALSGDNSISPKLVSSMRHQREEEEDKRGTGFYLLISILGIAACVLIFFIFVRLHRHLNGEDSALSISVWPTSRVAHVNPGLSRFAQENDESITKRFAQSLLSEGRRLGHRVSDAVNRGQRGVCVDEMEWDNSELGGLKITVNPLEEEDVIDDNASYKDDENLMYPNCQAVPPVIALKEDFTDDEDEEQELSDGESSLDDALEMSTEMSDCQGGLLARSGCSRRSQLLEWDDLELPPTQPHVGPRQMMTRSVTSSSCVGSNGRNF